MSTNTPCLGVPTRRALPRLAGLVLATILGLLLAVNPSAAPHADAAVSAVTTTRAVKVAAAQKGVPYRYGGTSPRTGFDCSGLTMYAYARAGKHIPRTALQQYRAAARIAPRSARPGDLVFFHRGTSIYHVAIYAGAGRIWHAPKPGKRVAEVRLWTSAVSYGRVR